MAQPNSVLSQFFISTVRWGKLFLNILMQMIIIHITAHQIYLSKHNYLCCQRNKISLESSYLSVVYRFKYKSSTVATVHKSPCRYEPAGSGSLKIRKSHLIYDALNVLDLLSPPCGDGLALLDKVLETCSINNSSPSAHALFVASRIA